MKNDGAREIRAMVLSSLPCPPMPLMVSRRLNDEHGTTDHGLSACSSFDLISHFLNLAASAKNTGRDLDRKNRQQQCHVALIGAIDSLKTRPTAIDDVWPIFSDFTRGETPNTVYLISPQMSRLGHRVCPGISA